MPKSPATHDSEQPPAVPFTPPGLASGTWSRAAGAPPRQNARGVRLRGDHRPGPDPGPLPPRPPPATHSRWTTAAAYPSGPGAERTEAGESTRTPSSTTALHRPARVPRPGPRPARPSTAPPLGHLLRELTRHPRLRHRTRPRRTHRGGARRPRLRRTGGPPDRPPLDRPQQGPDRVLRHGQRPLVARVPPPAQLPWIAVTPLSPPTGASPGCPPPRTCTPGAGRVRPDAFAACCAPGASTRTGTLSARTSLAVGRGTRAALRPRDRTRSHRSAPHGR